MEQMAAVPTKLPHVMKTFTFAKHNDTPIELDVHLPNVLPAKPVPVILFFHGGFVATGHRSLVPSWLVNAYLRRGWITVSADHRCLPESTGLDVLEDIQAAWAWIVNDMSKFTGAHPDTSRMSLAGASGGGWCAIVGATNLENPKPKASFPMYPMAESAADVRLVPEPVEFMPPEKLEATLKEMSQRVADGVVSAGFKVKEDFSDTMTHWRSPYILAMKQSGTYLDYLTGVPGMGKRMSEKGVVGALEGEREDLKKLFPLEFGALSKDTPPMVVSHGTADLIISPGESERFVKKAKEGGATIDYYPVEGGIHGVGWYNGDIEDEQADLNLAEIETAKAFKRFLEHVER